MRLIFRLALAITAFAAMLPSAAHAGKIDEPGGRYDQCVRTFFDPNAHDWLAIENTCSDPIQIDFEPRRRPGLSGTMELRGGQRQTTGADRDEYASFGGFVMAVCALGFVPIDDSGVYWHGVGTYVCRKWAQGSPTGSDGNDSSSQSGGTTPNGRQDSPSADTFMCGALVCCVPGHGVTVSECSCPSNSHFELDGAAATVGHCSCNDGYAWSSPSRACTAEGPTTPYSGPSSKPSTSDALPHASHSTAAATPSSTHTESDPGIQSAQAEAARREALASRYEQEKAAAKGANDANASNLATSLAKINGGGNEAVGTSWMTHIGFGGGGILVPLFAQTVGVGAPGTSTVAAGLGPRVSAAIWPLFTRHFALGAEAGGAFGGFALPGGSSYVGELHGALKVHLGWESSFTVVAELGYGARAAGASEDSGDGLAESQTSGSVNYGYVRWGAGMHLCTAEQANRAGFCDSAFVLTYNAELPDYETDFAESAGESVRVAFEAIGGFTVAAEVSWDYPIAGDHGVNFGVSDKSAVMGTLTFEHNWDYFHAW